MWFKLKKNGPNGQTPNRLSEKLKKTSAKKTSDKPSKWPSMVHCSFRRSHTAAKLRVAASPTKSVVAPITVRKPLPAVPSINTSTYNYPRAIRCGTSVISIIRASTIIPVAAFLPSSYGAAKRSASSSHLSGPYRSGPRVKAARMTTVVSESVYDSVYAGSEEEAEENIYDEIIPTSSTPMRVYRKRGMIKRATYRPVPHISRPQTAFQRSTDLDLMQVSTMTSLSVSPKRPFGRSVNAGAKYCPLQISGESSVYALHGEQMWPSCLSVYDQVASDSSDSEIDDDDDEIYGWSDEEENDVPTAAFGQCTQSQLYSPVDGVPRSSGLKWMRRESYIVQ